MVGNNVMIGHNCVLRPNTIIGNNTKISHFFSSEEGAKIGVGDDTILGPAVVTLDKPPTGDAKGVTIGKRCFIGASSVLLPGITIGDDVIIGAGSVVTKDCLEPGMYMGTPCQKVE